MVQLKKKSPKLCKQAGVVTELLDSSHLETTSEAFMTELEKSWEDSDRKDLALKTIRQYRDEGYQLGEKDGLKKGEQSGKEQKALEMAKALKQEGVDWQVIVLWSNAIGHFVKQVLNLQRG